MITTTFRLPRPFPRAISDIKCCRAPRETTPHRQIRGQRFVPTSGNRRIRMPVGFYGSLALMTEMPQRMMTMTTLRPTWISFGGTAAIVSSMGLILGLDAATSSQRAIMSSLLIVALADNLTDSLSVHMYQEAERLESHLAFVATAANFVTRLIASLSFVALVIVTPRALLTAATAAWGFLLLTLLTYRLARARGANAGKEIVRHLAVAAIVLLTSRLLGTWLSGLHV